MARQRGGPPAAAASKSSPQVNRLGFQVWIARFFACDRPIPYASL